MTEQPSTQSARPKPFDPMPVIARTGISAGAGVAAAILYGIVTRSALNDILNAGGALSITFFILTPLALGFLTVMLAPRERRTSLIYGLFAPWLATLACMVIAAILSWDYAFCIILAMPIFLGLASLGGGIGLLVWLAARRSQGTRLGALAVVLMLPYLSAAVERGFPAQSWTRTVETRIEIAAPADVVWSQITDLAPIQPEERPFAWYPLVGLPRPIEAKMACQQVGCVRRGQWEDGLAFDGTVTRITPGRGFTVSLKADTSHVVATLAPLQAIGGRTFGMVDDGYQIEALGEGRSALTLSSTYRVATRLNPYASFWLDRIMRDIQGSILGVEKGRAERIAAGE